MTNIQKINKLLIAVIIISVIAFLLNIINLSMFATDFTQITAQIQMVAGFIPDQDVQNINSLLDFANNAASVARALLVTLAAVTAISILVMLLIVRLFAIRSAKHNSVFNFSGLIISSGALLYLQYSSFPSFSGIISIIMIISAILVIAISAIYIAFGCYGIYKTVMADDFNARNLAFDFAKIVSFIFIFYTVAQISLRISMYMSAVALVKTIDLAAMIDIMNYVPIDWNSILPQQLLETGIVSNDSINLLLNNLADQYLLSYASQFIQDLILSVVSSIIFTNIVAYVSTLLTSIGVLITIKGNFDYKNYVTIGLMLITAVVGYVFIGGLLVNILATGLMLCIILVAIEIYKEYKAEW